MLCLLGITLESSGENSADEAADGQGGDKPEMTMTEVCMRNVPTHPRIHGVAGRDNKTNESI